MRAQCYARCNSISIEVDCYLHRILRTFARVSGYVEQFDIHSPQATVKEALWFSARLRLTNDIGNSRAVGLHPRGTLTDSA